ncbi:unnamed protein product [Adineta ricciae]|uniref:Uncharacterized protein n=1 Tax=Adineta ricciae TaxID=249248 RepID=A0A814LU03_ADIRI|nr:unnamed protein product [Adineta ricciae]CAF1070293.1 unnamed protein product [Adineta ricciae]
MATVASRTVPTTAIRRAQYQSQTSTGSVSLNRSSSVAESSTPNDGNVSSTLLSANPLVTITYSTILLTTENQQVLVNSYSTCRRLLDHMKSIIGSPQDEVVDLMDNDGKLKELNAHANEYAVQYLPARNNYYALKVEVDSTTGDKRYTPNFNIDQIDQKICTVLTNSLNSLNKSSTKIKRSTGPSKLNTSGASSSSTSQAKTKRASSRK